MQDFFNSQDQFSITGFPPMIDPSLFTNEELSTSQSSQSPEIIETQPWPANVQELLPEFQNFLFQQEGFEKKTTQTGAFNIETKVHLQIPKFRIELKITSQHRFPVCSRCELQCKQGATDLAAYIRLGKTQRKVPICDYCFGTDPFGKVNKNDPEMIELIISNKVNNNLLKLLRYMNENPTSNLPRFITFVGKYNHIRKVKELQEKIQNVHKKDITMNNIETLIKPFLSHNYDVTAYDERRKELFNNNGSFFSVTTQSTPQVW